MTVWTALPSAPEVPEGQVYAEFQSYCKALQTIGVVLAVDSKNDEANALAGLNHPDSVLHRMILSASRPTGILKIRT